jgi:hypothetical protein
MALAGFLLLGLPLCIGWPFLPYKLPGTHRWARERFYSQWTTRFRACRTLAQVKALTTGGQPSYLDTRVFRDGSWVAITWHSIHDEGGEWDGSVLMDSRGRLFRTDHHFCGEEGFQAEFQRVAALSLEEFYQRAGFTPRLVEEGRQAG